jgi:uncharacterized repeat protein (TIGR02543 family)
VNEWYFSSDTVTSNITLYAKWTPNPPAGQYTVTFNSQGGSSVSSITVTSGARISEPPAPTRSGYTFAGWYREPACLNAWNFSSDTVTSNVTLYAKWTSDGGLITCAVLFDSRGGSKVPDQVVAYGTKLTVPENPTRSSYIFAGWYMESTCINAWDFKDVVTKSMVLYAKWSVYGAPLPPFDPYVPTEPTTSDSGGGGCDTGIAALVPALVALMIWKKRG